VIAKCDMSRASRPGEGFAAQARVVRAAAQRHGLRHGYDEIGEPIIPGKRGHLYLDGDVWCWALVPDRGHAPWTGRLLSNAKDDSRLEILVEGNVEALFRLRSEDDLRDIAVRWCKCRTRRRLTEEQKARAIENLNPYVAKGLPTEPERSIAPSRDPNHLRAPGGGFAPVSVPVSGPPPEERVER
jgi:hypothetical protein